MEKIKNIASAAFNIRQGEWLPAALLFAHSFCIGIALVFFETSSYAMFLKKWDATTLPYVYIVSAFVITFSGFVYAKLQEWVSFSKLLVWTILFFFVSIAAFYVLLIMSESKWVVGGLVVWHNLMVALVGIEFWGLAGHMLNVRQGKRLFGLIGTGEITAVIVTGFSVSFLVEYFGTKNLFLFSAAGMFVCLAVLAYIIKIFAKEFTPPDEDREDNGGDTGKWFKDRYLLLIFTFVVCSIFGYYLLDYVFYDQVETWYTKNGVIDEKKVASFLGIYAAVLGIVNLFTNAFVPGRLITRYGLGASLLAVPVIVGIGSGSAAAAFSFAVPAIFFWIVVGTKLMDEVCRSSIGDPSLRILYQPIPPGSRLKVQTALEAMVEPIAGAIAGGLLIVMTNVLKFEAIHIISAIVAIIAAWVALGMMLRREYTVVLTNALAKRKLGGSLSLDDASSIEVLKKGLKSDIPGEVIYCLNMLEEIEHESLLRFMVNLLGHPNPSVRKHVLEKIGNLGLTKAMKPVTKRLEIEEDPVVAGTILRTLCALAETDAFDRVFPYLEHTDLEIRKGAMVGLLRNGGIDGVLSAGAKLNKLLDETHPPERKFAAQVLGDVGISGFYRPLMKLLRDEDPAVRHAAIVASGKLKNPRLLPLLLENLSNPEISNVSFFAIVAFGQDIVEQLEKAFDKEGQSTRVRKRIIRALGKIKGAQAVEFLRKRIDYSEEELRTLILSALVLCKYQAGAQETSSIFERIKNEVADAVWTLSVLMDIGEQDTTQMLANSLKMEFEKNRRRIFMLLAMVYPARSILSAQKNLASESPDIRANAIEVLDNVISMDIKPYVIPLLDDITPTQRHSQLIAYFPQKGMNRHERLKELLSRSQQWTASWSKACALFTVGKIATMEFYDSVVSALSDPDSTVRETAIWALGCLNPDDLVDRLQPMTQDRSRRVSEYARFVINSVGFASIPMGRGYLTRSGRYTVELFMNILVDEGERRVRRCRAANILSRFKGEAAKKALLDGLTIPDKTVRSAVLDALVKGKFEIKENLRGELLKLLRIEIADAKRILSSIVIIMTERHSDRLVDALNQEISSTRKRALSILTLLCDHKKTLVPVFYWYIYQDKQQIPKNVAQMLDTMLAAVEDDVLRKKISTLFNYRDFSRLRTIKELRSKHTKEEVAQHLKQIAFSSSLYTLSWSQICALEMIVNLGFRECAAQITEKLRDPQDLVRATAAWAIFNLDPESYEKVAGKIRNDPSPLVSRTAKQLACEG